jgi:hypothetical protein
MTTGIRDLLALSTWTVSGPAASAAVAGTRDVLSLTTHFLSGTAATAATTGNVLFVDCDVEVVEIEFADKVLGGVTPYQFSQRYYDAHALYPGSPVVYPLLVQSPQARRGIGNSTASVAIRYDVDIQLYGKTSLDRHGRTIVDLLEEFEVHGGTCTILYYPKPCGGQTATTTDAIVQTLEVVGAAYDDASGVVTLRAADSWFKDKEISRRLQPGIITDVGDQAWIDEYGAIVFGEDSAQTTGIFIDAPRIDWQLPEIIGDPDNRLTLFSGWSPAGNPNYVNRALMVKGQDSSRDLTDWYRVHLQPDPDVPAHGDDGFLFSDPDEYARSLSLYSRGLVWQPEVTDQAEILTGISVSLKKNQYYWCADFPGSQVLFRPDAGGLSPGDKDFTFGGWIKVDTLQEQGIAGAGNIESAGSTCDWALRMTSANKFAFRVQCAPSQYVETVWGTAAVAGTWYYVMCWHDQAGNTVNISVNDAAAVSTSTLLHSGTAQNGDDDYIILASGASSSNDTYNDTYVTIVSGTGEGQTRKIKDYVGSSRKAKVETNFGKNPDNTSVYAITVIPKNTGEVEQKKPFQVGFTGNALNYFDGKLAMIGFWNGILDPSYRTSVYNSGAAKAHEDLTDNEKFNLHAWWNLDEFYGVRKDTQGSQDLTDTGVPSVPGKRAVTAITSEHGTLQVAIYPAVYNATSAAYEPFGSALRTTKLDPAAVFFATSIFAIDPPLILIPEQNYFFELTWSNHSDHPHSIWSNYQTAGGEVSYARLNSDKERGWETQTNTQLGMALYCMGFGADDWTDTVSSESGNYSTLQIAATQDNADRALYKGLTFKIGIAGVTDVDGSYTGTSSSVLNNPASIIRFVLLHPDMLGLDASAIDDDIFTAVRNTLIAGYGANSDGFHMAITIDRKTFAEEFIAEVCRQARIVLYKLREGTLALYFPMPWMGADVELSEHTQRGNMALVDVADNPYDTVVNDVKQLYAPDVLNVAKDPAFIRRAESDRFNGLLWSDDAHDVGEDPFRQDMLIASQALYGRRQHRLNLGYYDNEADALAVHQYIIDRYSSLQKQLRVQVSRKLYYNDVDLFSRVRVSHSGIQTKGGAALLTREHYDGAATSSYYEGIPTPWWSAGTVDGEVVEITYSGTDMLLTIETMNAFNA